MFSGKYPETPNLTCFGKPKWHQIEKSMDLDQNLIDLEGGKDTSSCQISDHPSHMFSRQCPENANITLQIKWKYHQNEENQQTVTKMFPVPQVVRIHYHIKLYGIPRLRSNETPGNPKCCLLHYDKNCAKMRNMPHAQFRAIPPMQRDARKSQIWPAPLS